MADDDRGVIFASGVARERGAKIAEVGAQRAVRHHREFTERAHTHRVERAFGRRANAGHRADRQRCEEGRHLAGRDDAKTVRLGVLGGDLRGCPPGGEADRDRERQFLSHAAADGERDQFRRAADALQPRDVNCRFVRPGHLNERGITHQDGAEAAREVAVIGTIDRQENRVRATALRLRDGHAGAHPEVARRIRRGAHDTATAASSAHNYRQPDEFRAARDLGGREKGIEVCVEDGAGPVWPASARARLWPGRFGGLTIRLHNVGKRATEGECKQIHRGPPHA